MLLTSISWSQNISTPTKSNISRIELDKMITDIAAFQSGRPSLTASPEYLNLIRISSGIQFTDGSVQVSSPAVVTAGVGYAIWVTTAPAGASSTTITGLDTTVYDYRIEVNIRTSVNSGVQVQCNNDTGLNYTYAGRAEATGGSATVVGTSVGQIYISYASTTRVTSARSFSAIVNLVNDDGTTNVAMVTSVANYLNDTPQREHAYVAGVYAGSAATTSCSIVPNSGTITGRIKVFRVTKTGL